MILSENACIMYLRYCLCLLRRIISGIIQIDQIDDPSNPTLILKTEEARLLQPFFLERDFKVTLSLSQIDQLISVNQPTASVKSFTSSIESLLEPIIRPS